MIRSAAPGDAAELAILDNIASHGLSLWFWQLMAEQDALGKSSLEIALERFSDEKSKYGFSNAVVAIDDQRIAGSAVGFMQSENRAELAKEENPVLKPISELFAQCDENTWLLDSISVYARYRGKGIGAALLEHAFGRARRAGADNISLVAEDSNYQALKLYEAKGFKVIDSRDCVPFNPAVTTKSWVLMQAPLN